MSRPFKQSRLAAGLATGLILALAQIPATTFLSQAALAQANNIKIDSLKVGDTGKEVEFKGIEVVGSTLTQDEFTKLFNKDTPKADALALLAKLKATSAGIAEIAPKDPEAGGLVIRGLKAEGIADGKIARLSLGGFDGKPLVEGQAATVKGGALTADDIDLSTLLKAAQTGSVDDIAPKVARMTWNGFEVSFPDKDTPATAPGGNIFKVSLGAFDGQATYQGTIPLQSKGGLRNLVLEPPKASAFGQTLAGAGLDKLDISLSFSGNYDPAKKSYALDDFTVTGVNVGSVGLRAELADVNPDSLKGPPEQKLTALMGTSIAAIELRIANGGGFEKILDFAAKQQGTTPDALRAQASGMAEQMIPMFLAGNPGSAQVASAVKTFLASGKSITLSVKGKAGPLKIAELASAGDPMALLQKVTLGAAAEGGAAAPAAAAPAPQQQAQAAPQAAQAGRKLIGIDAWNAIVGNSITGKNDDGDDLTEFYTKDGKLRQLADDDVTEGTWTLKGQQVCLTYGDDDDDDAECYRIEVQGDIATYIGSDGKGKRYTIVKGNPKKL